MNNLLGDFIKGKITNTITKDNKKKADIIKELGITTQYLNDIENGKRVPSPNLMKKMIELLKFDEKEKIQLYDLASDCHKDKKIPADIEDFIVNNKNAKKQIRKMMSEMEKK